MTKTARDSLEKIVEEMREVIPGRSPIAMSVGAWAARIEALSPSKAEREFMEAAEAWAIWCGFNDSDRQFPLAAPQFIEVMDAYRALLAERGKDA